MNSTMGKRAAAKATPTRERRQRIDRSPPPDLVGSSGLAYAEAEAKAKAKTRARAKSEPKAKAKAKAKAQPLPMEPPATPLPSRATASKARAAKAKSSPKAAAYGPITSQGANTWHEMFQAGSVKDEPTEEQEGGAALSSLPATSRPDSDDDTGLF